MTLFRGYGSDLPLMEWLEQKIWPAEARLSEDDVYWGTRLACVEMIRTGTVRFWDMYWHPVAVARAVADAGMRATVGPPLIDGLDASRSARRVRVRRRGARRTGRLRADGAAVARAARHLHGQRAVARVGRRAVGRSRPPRAAALPGDGRRGDRLRRAHRAAPGRVPRPHRAAVTARGALPRCVDGRSGARARRGAGRDGRDQSSVEPEARGRPHVPVPACSSARDRGRARHRWRIVQQQPGPRPGRQGAGARAEVRARRPGRAPCRRSVGRRHRRVRARTRCAPADGGGARRLPPGASVCTRARAGALPREPRLRRARIGRDDDGHRRHHRHA